VLTNDKQRFELSGDKQKMRARQGHSVAVEADWPITEPPDVLYHGTGAKVLGPIFQEGLLRGKRHHVHLSQTVDQAASVGRRRGTPTVIEVDARGMSREGFVFRRSSNDVWLADHVPPRFLRLLA
jgi:putative RNA 2'-phosphotransferase